jgi:hypothetical protein
VKISDIELEVIFATIIGADSLDGPTFFKNPSIKHCKYLVKEATYYEVPVKFGTIG